VRVAWSRLRAAAVITPVGLAAALAPVAASAAPGTASAAATAGWHIQKKFAMNTTIFSVAGVTANDAWLAGGSFNGGLLVQHWNGTRWGAIATPASTSGVGNAVIAAAGNTVWAFDDESNSTDNAVALRRTGGRWTTHQFPDFSTINAAAVFSPTDAWAFGERFGSAVSSFVRRFNGTRWRAVATPIVPNDASAVSANDIWAVGQTVASLSTSHQVFAAAQWTRGKWRLLHFPRLRLPAGAAVTLPHIVALGPANVWVDFAVSKGMGIFPGTVLLHFNGARWTRVAVPFKSTFMLANLARDGSGGIWIAATTNSGLNQYIYHLRAGHWSRALMPSVSGDGTQVMSIAPRPGTAQAWAVGDMVPVQGGTPQGVLLHFRA